MAQGVYGIVRGANFNPSDAEIWLSYRSSRSDSGDGFTKVETSKFLTTETDANGNQIGGIYRLKLPLNIFNKIGIYCIYIRPKQIETTIKDIGILLSYPEIRGIVLDTSTISDLTIDDNSLVGYRIEYKNPDGSVKPNLFRIITSNNKCEPTNQTTNGTVSYRFNDNAKSTFITVTPSSASSARPLSLPYIGSPQDNIILTNTFFNPEMIEIEITENDIESLYSSINGNQIVSLESGTVTTYDKNNNIMNQVEFYDIKENTTGVPVYKVKQTKTDIDFTQNYNDIISNV